jgi:hypothetical protein
LVLGKELGEEKVIETYDEDELVRVIVQAV